MPNNILIKKSSVAARVPTTADLDYGELALNYADGAVYYKTSGNVIARLNPTETDTLATVTTRGATTSNAITTGGLTVNGNVGIGTAGPTSPLHVITGDSNGLRIDATATSRPSILFGNATTGLLTQQTVTNAGDWLLDVNVGAGRRAIEAKAGGNILLAQSGTGNVGIGAVTPTAKLHVVGNSILQVGTNDTGYVYNQITTSALSGGGLFGVEGSTAGSLITGTLAYATVLSSSSSSTPLQLGTSGAVRMTILGAGNVGIGTTSPGAYKVALSSSLSTALSINTTSGAIGIDLFNSGVQLASIGTGNNVASGGVNTDLGFGTAGTSGNIVFATGASYTERLRITSTGNIGIGATAPSTVLDVDINRASQTDGIRIKNSNTGGYGHELNFNLYGYAGSTVGSFDVLSVRTQYNGTTGYVTFLTKAQPQSTAVQSLFLQGDGNVGIGTASPTYHLQVAGTGTQTSVASFRYDTGIIGEVGILSDATGGLLFARDGSGTSNTQINGKTNGHSYFNSGGNVGIGTTTPTYALHINDTASPYNAFSAGILGTDLLKVNANGISLEPYATGNGSDGIYVKAYDSTWNLRTVIQVINQSAAVSPHLVLQPAGGNVGIGTTSPLTTLQVGGGAGTLSIINTGDYDGSTTSVLGIGRNTVVGDAYLSIGTNQTNDYSYLQSQNAGAGYYKLLLNPNGGNVGIGTTSPSQALHVSGSARITGAIIDSSNSAGTNGQVLTSTVTGTAWSSSGASVGGTGTAGKITKWSSASVLADSVITESSGNIGIDTAPTQKLDVNGNIGWGTDHVLAYATLTTTATTANQIIASISATTYRTCKFIIQAVDAAAGKYQSQEIMAIHNGSAVAHTEYTAITVGAAVATFDVDISGSTVRLLCTPLSVNSTVFKISMQLIKV